MKRRAFTLLELLVAISVIGILASLVTVNFNESRARARDANRAESVRAYAASLEQWKASNGTYFIYLKSTGGSQPSNCEINISKLLTCSDLNAVGLEGGGWGGMTRKRAKLTDLNPVGYATNSIADALVTSGFLSRVRLDPLDKAFNTNTTEKDRYSDFILTLCKAGSADPADSPKTAQEYAIYTQLERPDSNSQSIADSQCGGPKTPSEGWDTFISR